MIHDPKLRRLRRVRGKLKLTLGVPRLSVLRTNTHIWAQIIDDKHGKTLASASSKSLKLKEGTKTQQAAEVGRAVAKVALDKKIRHVKFDRGLYLYHGRVKALADGAREAGLVF